MSTPASPVPTFTVLGSTVKAVLVPVPPGAVTTTVAGPATDAVGTVKVIVVSLLTVSLMSVVVAMPFTVSEVTPARLVPVMVTEPSGSALVGEKLVIVGAVEVLGSTVKVLFDVAVPAGAVRTSAAVWAVAGTVKVMVVALTTVKVVATVPSSKLVVPLRLAPVTVTVAPGMPLAGVKLLIVGSAGAAVGSSFLVQLANHKLPSTALAPL